jgi:leader peptidase (prepilin peptidase)/N-methyltransferase
MPDLGIFWKITVTIFGLLIGSFLNVVIARLPLDQSIVSPRSRCPKCEKSIVWYDNIPLVSYLLLRGRCRGCQAPISPRYPLVEVLCGLLFLASYVRFGLSPALFVRELPFCAILLAITFIDLDHRIIPDELSLGGLALGLATCWLMAEPGWLMCLVGAGLGFGVFYGLAWAYEKYSGRAGLGGGDIKLLAMIGAFEGPAGVFAAILISSVLGSLVGLGWGMLKGGKELQNIKTLAIPYGPFLVIGALYYYLLGDILWFRFTIPT